MEYDEREGEPLIWPDTDNATKFHAEEASPEKRAQIKRWEKYNSGVYKSGKWRDESKQRRIEKLARFDIIADRLALTDTQKAEARDLFDRLKLQKLGYSTELVAFCLCALVVRQDRRRIYHPNRSDENNDPLFLEFARQELSPRDQNNLINCMHQLMEHLSEFPWNLSW